MLRVSDRDVPLTVGSGRGSVRLQNAKDYAGAESWVIWKETGEMVATFEFPSSNLLYRLLRVKKFNVLFKSASVGRAVFLPLIALGANQCAKFFAEDTAGQPIMRFMQNALKSNVGADATPICKSDWVTQDAAQDTGACLPSRPPSRAAKQKEQGSGQGV